jgi:CO/xanthine dehydrogenase FAD-binding subunit
MDATVMVRGRTGERAIPFTDFHRLPGDTPERDNALGRGDLIVSIEVPACAEGRASHYLKVRDRRSYEFALVSAAAAVAPDGRRICSARLTMGGVAHKPWRLVAAEAALCGVSLDDIDTGFLCKALVEKVRLRAPGLQGHLHRWRSNGEIDEPERRLIRLNPHFPDEVACSWRSPLILLCKSEI